MLRYLNHANKKCEYVKAPGKVATHDLYCTKHDELVEVKNDNWAPKTGNVAFEKHLFERTRATVIIYVIADTAYLFDTQQLWDRLRQLSKEAKTVFRMAGDRDANPIILARADDILPTAKAINLEVL